MNTSGAGELYGYDQCKFQIEIELRIEPQNELEIYPNFEVTFREDSSFNLTEILLFFIREGLISSFHPIYYRDIECASYIYCNDAYSNNTWVSKSSLTYSGDKTILKLKYKKSGPNIALCESNTTPLNICYNIINAQSTNLSPAGDVSINSEFLASKQETQTKKKSRGIKLRNPERKIFEVEELISKWRALHRGSDPYISQNKKKMSLDEASNELNCSKKSLQDYEINLKRAHSLGFDFAENKTRGFGVLRRFVEEAMENRKKLGNVNEKNSKI